jgi:hypothetical protein
MKSIVFSSIPLFLREGSFYSSLNNEEEDGEIQIPAQCFAENDTVKDIYDFAQLVRATAFWGLYRIPQSLIAFCDLNEVYVWDALLEREHAELPFARSLRAIFTLRWQGESFLVAAIQSGITEIVEYLAAKYTDTGEAMSEAAELGRLDYLQLLRKLGHKWEIFVCDNAVRGGQVHCLQYLHTNGCPWDNYLYLTAAAFGQFGCMKYAFEQGLPWHPETAERLTEHGAVEMLKYAVEHGCLLDETSVIAAAEYGHSECLQYLLAVGCPMDDNPCYYAAEKGHVDCLKVLHQHQHLLQLQPSWDTYTTEVAANEGHLDCLVYLHENGCPWDEGTTASAASHGHLEVLRYALEHDCPYLEEILLYSLRTETTGGFQCLEYLIKERGIPFSLDGSEFLYAFTYANLSAMQYLVSQNCPYLETMLPEQAISNHLKSAVFQAGFSHAYDAKLVKCMEFAVASNWDIAKNGVELCGFIKSRAYKLPICAAYLAELNLV